MGLIKLLVVFVVMLVLLMRRTNLGAVMTGVSLLLGLLFQLNLAAIAQVFVATFTALSNLNLIVALALIMVMEEILRQEGVLQRMVQALQGLVDNQRIVLAALPALVGLIPSMGGAIFSAPMVDAVSQESGVTAERKAFINYWFRHIWECLSPIYPSVLLTIQIFSQSLADVLLVLLPVPFLTVLIGWPVAFHGLTFQPTPVRNPQIRRQLRDLASGVAPVAIVLSMVLLLRWQIAGAVSLVVVALLFLHRYTPIRLLRLAREAISPNILLSVAAVLFFKGMLEATQAITTLAPSLAAMHIPPIGLFFALPFLIGLLTGASAAFAGMASPILLSLMGGQAVSPAMVAILLVSGYGGVMLSPLHMCQVLTVSYFKADPGRLYRMFFVPEVAVTAISIAYLAFLQ